MKSIKLSAKAHEKIRLLALVLGKSQTDVLDELVNNIFESYQEQVQKFLQKTGVEYQNEDKR